MLESRWHGLEDDFPVPTGGVPLPWNVSQSVSFPLRTLGASMDGLSMRVQTLTLLEKGSSS